MNLVDCHVIEVLDKKTYTNDMKDLEWLNEPNNVYTVKYNSWGIEDICDIWIKYSEDKGQVKKGYCFQR